MTSTTASLLGYCSLFARACCEWLTNMTSFVNTCVFLTTTKKTLLPWTINEVPEADHTFIDYFVSVMRPKIPSGSREGAYELEISLVGPNKDSLDPVDPNLLIQPVLASFGRFLKYCVTCSSNDLDATNPIANQQNAFEYLMESARQIYLQQGTVATGSVQLVVERNKRHKLYNDIIKFLTSRDLTFKTDEVDTSGVKLVRLLCDILWHIDGHHHVFQSRSLPLPVEFQSFSNYNVPEFSKHRKRRTYNLSSDLIQQFVLDLSVILDESYWDRDGWCEFKQLLLSLLCSLSGYVEYLNSKNKMMKLRHKSPTPVRDLGSNLSIKYLSPCSGIKGDSSFEKVIERELMKVSDYEYVEVTQFLPSDPAKKPFT